MNKAYDKVTWQNTPSTATPLNASNLNKMSDALDTIDDRVITLDGQASSASSAITALQEGKVDKVAGKGLSTNDYTNDDKTKLAGISAEANKVEVTPVVTEGTTLATISIDGVDTAIKGSDIDVDDEMSPTSPNPVQNKAIYSALNDLLPEETAEGNPISITDASGLSAKSCEVAFSPIQDLHGQSAPYPAGGGKNKYSGTDIETTSDGSSHTDYTMSLPAGTYTFSAQVTSDSENSSVAISLRNSQNTQIRKIYIDVSSSRQSTTVTLEEDVAKMYFYAGYDTSTKANTTYKDIQIESGSSMTDYAPYSNICPIIGRDSASLYQPQNKNLFGDYTSQSGTDINSSGEIISGVNYNVYKLRVTNKQYVLSFLDSATSSGYHARIVARDTNDNDYSPVFVRQETYNATTDKLTLSADLSTLTDVGYIYVALRKSTSNIQLEYGTTATDYIAYSSITHTATFPSTVYGGVWKATEGKAVIDRVIYIFNGKENLSAQSNNRVYTNSITDIYIPTVTDEVEVLCSHFKGVSYDDRADGTVYKVTGNAAIYFRDVTYCTDATTFKNFLTAQYNNNTPVTIAYKLATPTEITLTAEQIELLKGNNVLWTDGDNITLKYSADIKQWVLAQLQS